MYGHERSLVRRMKGQPFALVGVNSDRDRAALRGALRKHGITWRSWWDGGTRGPIARSWGVRSWPTVYVLDHRGVIRYRGLRGGRLDDAVDRLVREVRREAEADGP
jgi:hypothetical protein